MFRAASESTQTFRGHFVAACDFFLAAFLKQFGRGGVALPYFIEVNSVHANGDFRRHRNL